MTYSTEFDCAYNLWPKPAHKFEAWVEWQKQFPTNGNLLFVPAMQEVFAALAWQSPLYSRRELSKIPDFRRWLHGRMWEDDAVDGRGKPQPARFCCPQCPHALHLPAPCPYCKAIERQNGKPFCCSGH